MNGNSSVPQRVPSPTEVKKSIYSSLQRIKELRDLSQSSLSSLSTMTNEEAEEVLKKCDDLKKSIEETTKDFNTASKKIEIVNKMLKSERKKRWKIKRRRIQRVENSFYRSILAERNKLVI